MKNYTVSHATHAHAASTSTEFDAQSSTEAAITLLYDECFPTNMLSDLLTKLGNRFEEMYPGKIVNIESNGISVPASLSFSAAPLPEDTHRIFSYAQREWMGNSSIYPQLTFLAGNIEEEAFNDLMSRDFYMQMVWFDTLVSHAEAGDFLDDLPQVLHNLSSHVDKETRLNLIRLNPEVLLLDGLFPLRTELLIKARAIIDGRNPEDTYQRFRAKAGRHFFDYSLVIP